MSDFENLKEELPSKEKSYSSFTGKKVSGKEYKHVLNDWIKSEMKAMEDYYNLYYDM